MQFLMFDIRQQRQKCKNADLVQIILMAIHFGVKFYA